MAFTPNNFLYHPDNTVLKDYQHAARIFTDDQFRLAPKHKFLYHVAFNINQAALKNIELVERHRNEINVLVKAVDLPQFKLNVETLNQYNRKKNIQTTHKYEPLTIMFHDDNMGLINQMWQNYYSYYYADPTTAWTPGSYNRTATKNFNYITNSYGLDNRSTTPFFNYITIYQMARHEYVSYTLINPMISNWNHNKLDSSQNAVHDFSMQLQFEAVAYGSGQVTKGDPEGFGIEHYDMSQSSLQGGAVSTVSPSFAQDRANLDVEIINTVKKQINTYENTRENLNTGSVPNLSTTNSSVATSTSGIRGYSFPQSMTTQVEKTVAKQSKAG